MYGVYFNCTSQSKRVKLICRIFYLTFMCQSGPGSQFYSIKNIMSLCQVALCDFPITILMECKFFLFVRCLKPTADRGMVIGEWWPGKPYDIVIRCTFLRTK